MSLSESEFASLRQDSAADVESYLLDADGLDAVFFLYTLTLYTLARLGLNCVTSGRHDEGVTEVARRHSKQQYVMLFCQKGCVLPVCAYGWARGALPPELMYLLTGCYVLSDSMVNATPVRGGSWGGNWVQLGSRPSRLRGPTRCVACAYALSLAGLCVRRLVGLRVSPMWSPRALTQTSRDRASPPQGVHVHHLCTLVLCAVGAHMPPGPVVEGALCIFIGEAGSLWLAVCILWPTPTNIKLRFWSFVVSRLALIAIFLDIVRALEQSLSRLLMVATLVSLAFDNWRTLRSMGGVTGVVGGSLGRSDSLAAGMDKQLNKQQ
jgi:hypothetical protein